MYGLPEDTDLAAFIGCELELVSIGSYQVNLNFGGLPKIGITIEGDYAVSKPGGGQTRYSAAPEGACGLVALLSSRVTDVRISEHGTTTIYFADGAAITIYDSEEHYESIRSTSASDSSSCEPQLPYICVSGTDAWTTVHSCRGWFD